MGLLFLAPFLFSLQIFAESLIMTAEYEVPVREELKPHANFVLEGVEFDKSELGVELSYLLPKELVAGEELRLLFERNVKDNFGIYQLKGNLGDARCIDGVNSFTCIVKYHSIANEPVKIREYLKTEFEARPLLFDNLLEISKAFHTDPGGVVKINF